MPQRPDACVRDADVALGLPTQGSLVERFAPVYGVRDLAECRGFLAHGADMAACVDVREATMERNCQGERLAKRLRRAGSAKDLQAVPFCSVLAC